jgi:hypothetical protein
MRTLMNTALATLVSAAPALAANGSAAKGSSFLLFLFLGFAALIIVFQFIPGLVLFASMIRGLVTRAPKKAEETLSAKPGGR